MKVMADKNKMIQSRESGDDFYDNKYMRYQIKEWEKYKNSQIKRVEKLKDGKKLEIANNEIDKADYWIRMYSDVIEHY